MQKKIPLLPSGLYDLLPPDASKETFARSKLLAVFSAYGYAQVSPPLMEFETSLLAGRGEEISEQTFRILDPVARDMMGIRADMTTQVARIASTRLGSAPRPLRLCYAGQILKSRPEPLRNERQLTQAGIELIGSDTIRADAEVIIIAAQALSALGIKDVSIDINLPGLVGELCPEAKDNPGSQARIKAAITQKNPDMVASLPLSNSKILAELMEAAGPTERAIAVMSKLKILQAEQIRSLSQIIHANCKTITLTLDPIEYRGFDYHSGIGFSIFARGLRHELGRGGRYVVEGENSTGFTLYITYLLPLLPLPEKGKSIMLQQNAGPDKVGELQAQGWTTLYALSDRAEEEAKRLSAQFMLSADGKSITEIK